MTTQKLHCSNKHYLLWLFLGFFLTGCLGGGSGSTSTTATATEGATLALLPASSNASGSIVLTALLKDKNNAPLAGKSIQFNFTAGNAETLTPSSAVTDSEGTAKVTVKDLGNDGGTVTVQAQYEALTAHAQVNFLANNNTQQNLLVTPSATVLQATDQAQIEVRLQDNAGVPLVGQSLNFSLKGQAILDRSSATTDSSGRALVKIIGVAPENAQLDISAGTLQRSLVLHFGANLTLLPADSTGSADGTTATQLVARLLDAQGSAIVGESIQFFSLAGNAELEFFTAQTSTNGQVSLNVRNRNVETSLIGVQAGTLPRREARIEFKTPTANTSNINVDEIELSADKTFLNPGGVANVQVALRKKESSNQNAQGDLLPNTPFSASASNGAQLLEVPTTTDSNGQAVFRLTHTQAENVTLTITSGGINRVLHFYFGGKLALSPDNLNANASAELTAILKDANNALVVGEKISFTLVGENATLNPAQAVTGNDGTAKVKVSDLSSNGGAVIVQAHSGELSDEATVQFFASLGENRQMEATVTPQVLASGNAKAQARIFSKEGFPVSRFPVSFYRDNQLLQTKTTDENGLVDVLISATTQANVKVEIRAGNASQQFTLYFGAQLTLDASNNTGIADGKTAVRLNVNLRDSKGAGIAGQTVNFRLVSGSAMLDAFQVVTDAQGRGELGLIARQAGEAAISASTGDLNSNAVTVRFTSSGIPTKINLRSSTLPRPLSLTGNDTITATVLDELDNPVSNAKIDFSTAGAGRIEPSAVTDANGQAQVIFSALTTAGISTITATVTGADNNPISAFLSLTVQPSGIGTIEVLEVTPKVIGIQGSSNPQSATLTFVVKDNLGNLVNNQNVDFTLGNTRLGGGESLSSAMQNCGSNIGNQTITACATTLNGQVKAVLLSGRVAGVVDVVATVRSANISTLARVSIAGGVPDARHLGLAAQYLNIAGGVHFGLQDLITAYVGDRFGNIVTDGTVVNFISEGGTIGTSVGSGAFSSTTTLGQATAILQSAAPTTPDLGGISPTGNLGLNRIVAYTSGSESFEDMNGNGYYDAGDKLLVDLSEPYIDANDSGDHEDGELYIDVNGNGFFDKADGQFQENTTIWASINVLFSAETQTDALQLYASIDSSTPLNKLPPAFVPNCSPLTLKGIQDKFGNPLVSGTKISISASKGEIIGTSEVEIADTQTPIGSLSFGLFATESPLSSTLTIEVTPPVEAGIAPGSNGKASLVHSLTCNTASL